MTTIAAYVPDLMDRSKVSAAGNVTFARTPGELARLHADIFVIDLSRPGVLDVVPSLQGRLVIGFGSHVATDVLDAARAAGIEEVLPRSKFFSRVTELLA